MTNRISPGMIKQENFSIPFSTPLYTTQIVSARKIPVKISGAFFSVINDVKYPSSATFLPDVVKYSKKYFVIHPPMTE